jgi:hypothetical protein
MKGSFGFSPSAFGSSVGVGTIFASASLAAVDWASRAAATGFSVGSTGGWAEVTGMHCFFPFSPPSQAYPLVHVQVFTGPAAFPVTSLQVFDWESQMAPAVSQVQDCSAPENISQVFHVAQRMNEMVRSSAIGQLTNFQT